MSEPRNFHIVLHLRGDAGRVIDLFARQRYHFVASTDIRITSRESSIADLSMTLVTDLETLKKLHEPGMRVFGLDLGTKTIGVAISDGRLSVAGPLTVIRRKKFTNDVEELSQLAEEHNVCALVVGLPLNMDGSEGPRAQASRAFVRNLEGKLDLPVVFWDERLSTVAAERAMIEADVSRKKRAERIDAAAASFILQGALDRLSNL